MNQNMVTAMFVSLTRNKIDSFYISFTINYDSRIKHRILFNTRLNWFSFINLVFKIFFVCLAMLIDKYIFSL